MENSPHSVKNISKGTVSRALFGPPAFFEGEDQQAYAALSDAIFNTVKPTDVIEEIWARDVIDHVWEVQRLRKLRAAFLDARLVIGLQEFLDEIDQGQDGLSDRWVLRDPEAITKVNELLKAADLSMDTVMAFTVSLYMKEFENMSRLIATAGVRRDDILREIERSRAVFAEKLRRVTAQTENAQADVVIEAPE